MIYILSFVVILCPIPIAFLLTSGLSRTAKVLFTAALCAFFIIVPILVFLLAGGTGS